MCARSIPELSILQTCFEIFHLPISESTLSNILIHFLSYILDLGLALMQTEWHSSWPWDRGLVWSSTSIDGLYGHKSCLYNNVYIFHIPPRNALSIDVNDFMIMRHNECKSLGYGWLHKKVNIGTFRTALKALEKISKYMSPKYNFSTMQSVRNMNYVGLHESKGTMAASLSLT